ncbi:MAG TPA: LPS export ABC transporter periplasmic protein LptC [Chthoniobacterales bacterium]|jgi:Lipopolysaccharide-assembly, LptC-related|nr:LPS export ABC transporter periplasmic protein LptC [Chthoniobacterales bacterium]
MKWFARLLAVFALCIAWEGELSAGSPNGERKIVLPIPIGHDVKGLRVPFRDDEGKMQFRMDIQWARRLDEQNVEMRSSVIQTYDQETNKPSAKVELKTSVMNMDTNVIVSHEPVVVSREDFRLTGDAMEFNTKTREGRVIGNVRLIIYNRDELANKKPDDNQLTREKP